MRTWVLIRRCFMIIWHDRLNSSDLYLSSDRKLGVRPGTRDQGPLLSPLSSMTTVPQTTSKGDFMDSLLGIRFSEIKGRLQFKVNNLLN